MTLAACTGATAQEPEPFAPTVTSPAQDPQRIETIDHVTPARDSIGPRPRVFRWTAARKADSYSVGVWNDVDRLIWRRDRIATTSVALPDDVELEAGTYFWTVAALRDGHQVADSGLAAFIVRTPEP